MLDQAYYPETIYTPPSLEFLEDQARKAKALGLNCLRTFPVAGHVVWGARTLAGADLLASEWKYVPVRRLALFLDAASDAGLLRSPSEPQSVGSAL